jgi:hypothetical protein
MSEMKGNKDFYDHLKQQVKWSKEAYEKDYDDLYNKAWYESLGWALREYEAIVGVPPE